MFSLLKRCLPRRVSTAVMAMLIGAAVVAVSVYAWASKSAAVRAGATSLVAFLVCALPCALPLALARLGIRGRRKRSGATGEPVAASGSLVR